MNDDRTDAELVAHVLAGRDDLFEPLVRRYQASLYRYAVGMLGQPDVAADVVQDAFVKAFTRLARCRDPGSFAAWLFRIVRNGCLDRLKAKSGRHVPLDETAAYVPEHEGPEGRLEAAEIGREVRAALEKLGADQREAFLLKHVEGLSYEEMSERLEASVSALKMRVKRAREELQAALSHVYEPEL